jgi:hypothetical protein
MVLWLHCDSFVSWKWGIYNVSIIVTRSRNLHATGCGFYYCHPLLLSEPITSRSRSVRWNCIILMISSRSGCVLSRSFGGYFLCDPISWTSVLQRNCIKIILAWAWGRCSNIHDGSSWGRSKRCTWTPWFQSYLLFSDIITSRSWAYCSTIN